MTDTSKSNSLFANEEKSLCSSTSAPAIPHARWVATEFESSDHIFIASAVLTPIALEHYTGSSRKYSVAY